MFTVNKDMDLHNKFYIFGLHCSLSHLVQATIYSHICTYIDLSRMRVVPKPIRKLNPDHAYPVIWRDPPAG
jgi:hypothetical protein